MVVSSLLYIVPLKEYMATELSTHFCESLWFCQCWTTMKSITLSIIAMTSAIPLLHTCFMTNPRRELHVPLSMHMYAHAFLDL